MNLTGWLPERRVRKLHLQAPNETLLHRGRILLEDALQTASIPGEQSGRLLLIRRLDVGRINSHVSATHLSRAIEEKLLHLGLEVTYAGSASASTSPVVFFHDQVDALVSLAVRLVHGPVPQEWFWQPAVPVWRPDVPVSTMLRLLLAAAFLTPLSTAGGVIFLHGLLIRSSLDAILQTISVHDGTELLQACGWQVPEHSAVPAGLPRRPKLQYAWHHLLLRWVSTWGRANPRSMFLTTVAIAAANPSRLSAPVDLLDSTMQWLQPQITDTAWQAAQNDPGLFDPQLHDSMSVMAPRSSQPSVREAGGHAEMLLEEGGEYLATHSSKWAGEPTDFAGFYFLLPLLVRLGLPDLLLATPQLLEAQLVKGILLRIAERIGVPIHDPTVLALETSPLTPVDEIPGLSFVAPRVWMDTICHPPHLQRPWQIRRQAGKPGKRILSDSTGRLVLALWDHHAPAVLHELLRQSEKGRRAPSGKPMICYTRQLVPPMEDLSVLVDTWILAIRRRLYRDAGMAVGQLVRRPGHIFFSATHIDITFDLQHADLRIRKAGLDIDPGWLSWFGRVVNFHYEVME